MGAIITGTQGLDLSRYNYQRGVPDFIAIRAAGYLYVILKLTEGVDYIDPYAYEMAKMAADAGLLVTFYHYATPGGSLISKNPNTYKVWWDPTDEAHDFMEALASSEISGIDLKVALDFEWPEEHLVACGTDDKGVLTGWAGQWLDDVLEGIGYLAQFYTYPSYMGNLVLPNATLNACPLWLSHFTHSLETPPKFEEEWGWERYELWQWENKGQVPGLIGDVDLNTAPFGLDRLSLADCGMPLSAQIDQHIANINVELAGLSQISAQLKSQGQ